MIAIAADCGRRPSEICGIAGDEYCAYCFDAACLLMKRYISEGKKPRFRTRNNNIKKNYSNFSGLIADLEQKGKFKNLPR